MIFFTKTLLLTLMLANTVFCSAQQVLIWDYDGTIVAQHTYDKSILPHVKSVMHAEKNINIICSGIRSLQPNTHTLQKEKNYYPHQDIEKFKQLMNELPIKAAVFSYIIGGTECWIIIKTDTDFEIRKAHSDTRYLHLIGYFQKPDTGMLHVIKDLLNEWHIKTNALLFIGDMLQDQQAAQTFGIPFQHAYSIHTGDKLFFMSNDKKNKGVVMPYTSNDDLPKSVLNSLTEEHAQTIFRKVFNNAYKEYKNEEQAFKVAWAAVKKEYEKNEKGEWVKK